MLKWFSLSAIRKEIKGHIRWPKLKEMVKDTKIVVSFIVVFSLFFLASDFIVALFLRLIGLGV